MKQNYYWDVQHHNLVYANWKEECMASISERISTKKRDGIKKNRDDIKPDYITDSQWKTMREQWATEKCLKKSQDAADSRTTNIQGKGMHKHTAGPVPFARIEHNMVRIITVFEYMVLCHFLLYVIISSMNR